jgi:hypothetical protein
VRAAGDAHPVFPRRPLRRRSAVHTVQDPLDAMELSHSERNTLKVKAHARLATTRRPLASAGGRHDQTPPVHVASNLHSRWSTSPIRRSDAVLVRTEARCAGAPRAGSTANTARHAGVLHDAPSRGDHQRHTAGWCPASLLPCGGEPSPSKACLPTRARAAEAGARGARTS